MCAVSVCTCRDVYVCTVCVNSRGHPEGRRVVSLFAGSTAAARLGALRCLRPVLTYVRVGVSYTRAVVLRVGHCLWRIESNARWWSCARSRAATGVHHGACAPITAVATRAARSHGVGGPGAVHVRVPAARAHALGFRVRERNLFLLGVGESVVHGPPCPQPGLRYFVGRGVKVRELVPLSARLPVLVLVPV